MRHSHPSPRVSHALKQSALSAHLSKTFKRPPFAAQYSHAQICVRLFPRFPAPRSPLHTASITCDCHRRVDNPAPLVIPLPGAYLRIAPRSSGPTLHFSARLSTFPPDSHDDEQHDFERTKPSRPGLAGTYSNTTPTPSPVMMAWPIDAPGGIRDQPPSTDLGAEVCEWSPSP